MLQATVMSAATFFLIIGYSFADTYALCPPSPSPSPFGVCAY